VGGHFPAAPFLGPRADLVEPGLDSGLAVLAPPDYLRDAQPVAQGRGVGFLGLGEEFRDFPVELAHLLECVVVAHRAVLAGVGEDLLPVDGEGDFPDLENLRPRGAF